MKLEKLISEFAAAARVANPVAVEGVWKFSADGHVFGITDDDSGGVAWIFGEIPAPPPALEGTFRKSVLEANFFMRGTGGAVFSINPESGAYTLMKSMPLDAATPEEFFAFVEKFVNTLATWKGLSSETREASGGQVPNDPPWTATAEHSQKEPDGADDVAEIAFPGMLRV